MTAILSERLFSEQSKLFEINPNGIAMTIDRGILVVPISHRNLGVYTRNELSQEFELSRVLEGHTDEVMSISMTPDGATIASGSLDKSVRVWVRKIGEGIKLS